MIFDDYRMFCESRKGAEPLVKELKERVDAFTGELIERYERDGSFEAGHCDAGDVVAPALAALVMVLAETIGGWQNSKQRINELKMVTAWLNELVCRQPLSEDARDILESYKGWHGHPRS